MPSASGGSGTMSWKACEPAWRRGWLCTISVSGSTSNLVVLGWLSLICWSGDLNSHQAFKGITDQAHQHPFSPLAPLVLGGSHPHQLRTVREGCYGRSGLDRLRQPSQQLAAASEGGLDHLEAVQSPVPQ